jgi:hypothetical protein
MPERWTLNNASNKPTFSYAYRASPYIHLMNLHSAMPIHIHLLLYLCLVFVLFVYVSVWKAFNVVSVTYCGLCLCLFYVICMVFVLYM